MSYGYISSEFILFGPLLSLDEILYVVIFVSSVHTAYNSLCRGLKYVLKIPCFTISLFWRGWISDFRGCNLGKSKTVEHFFIKLSQNICLINTYILIYRNARCDCMLWNTPWLYCIFVYFHVKLLEIASLIDVYILV